MNNFSEIINDVYDSIMNNKIIYDIKRDKTISDIVNFLIDDALNKLKMGHYLCIHISYNHDDIEMKFILPKIISELESRQKNTKVGELILTCKEKQSNTYLPMKSNIYEFKIENKK
jgi:hypothetical protein